MPLPVLDGDGLQGASSTVSAPSSSDTAGTAVPDGRKVGQSTNSLENTGCEIGKLSFVAEMTKRRPGSGDNPMRTTGMIHDEGFLRAIAEHPEDDALRLVYSDWLEEHGDPEYAEFIRVQVTLAQNADGKGDTPASELARKPW